MICHVDYSNKNNSLICQYQNNFDLPYTNFLIEFDGKHWCHFHCPIQNPEGVFSEKNKWNESKLNNFNDQIKKIIFIKIKENSDIDLSYTVFPNGFSMSDLDDLFSKREVKVFFKNCDFFCKFTINKDWIGDFIFDNSNFNELLYFSSRILNNFSFINSYFRKVCFLNCKIWSCSFENSEFYEDAMFNSCSFYHDFPIISEQKSNFDKAKFYKKALFKNSFFCDKFYFTETNFFDLADFSFLPVPHNEAIQPPMNIFYEIGFKDCKFQKSCFNNREFKSKTDFSGCDFIEAPHFFGCVFHQNTIFPPQKNFKDISSKDASSAYRAIYISMSNLKNREYESMFYALVQKSERKNGTQSTHIRLASWLYEVTTNYGQSIGIPLMLLLILTIIFSCLYSFLALPFININSQMDWSILANGLDSSVKQIVKPFSFYTENGNSFIGIIIKNNPVYFKLLSIFQTISSWSLITLFLLSLRWKFKKD